MPTVQATRRLSPKVPRLLHEHGLQARAVAGTGTDGRATTHDVLGAVAVRHEAAGGEVLASPLARRRLRGAGVDLTEAARASDGRRVTRADADLLLDQRSVRSASARVGEPRPTANEVEADVALLPGSVAVVHTRPHVPVRLPHADRATSDHATALLEDLRGAIASWTLPVGP